MARGAGKTEIWTVGRLCDAEVSYMRYMLRIDLWKERYHEKIKGGMYKRIY